jgi:hypothetical protein
MITKRTEKRLHIFVLLGVFIVFLSLITALVIVSKNMVFPFGNTANATQTQQSQSSLTPQISVITTGEDATITITGSDIASAIDNNAANYISNPEVNITSTGVTLKGQAKPFWNLGFDATLDPYVDGNNLKFNIISSHVGFVGLPSGVENTMAEAVNKAIESDLGDKIIVKSIKLSDNKIELTVQKRS